VLPFNYDDAIAGAAAFAAMHPSRKSGDDRAAVSADAKLMGQCINGGIPFFATADGRCCERVDRVVKDGCRLPLPQPICTQDQFDGSWFSNGQHELIDR